MKKAVQWKASLKEVARMIVATSRSVKDEQAWEAVEACEEQLNIIYDTAYQEGKEARG